MNLEQFYDDHVDKVYKFFYIKSLNKQVSEDLTSDTFVSFLRKSQSTDVEDKTKYLYGIMRNIWIEFLKNKYKIQLSDLANIENFEAYASDTISYFDEVIEPAARLRPYVDRLPDKQRDVLTMRVYQNMAISEVAEQLGKDANYVKTTYARAIRTLRSIVDAPFLNEGGVYE